MIVEENLGTLVSKFISERVDTPHPDEIDAWTQLAYTALFSAAFVIWPYTAKKSSSEDEMRNRLNDFIDEIAKHANVWINHKTQEALKISGLNITVNSIHEVKFNLSAMFTEAITATTEGKFSLEAARSHACFVHLQANLRRLAMVSKTPIDVQNVLKKGLAGCDAMAAEIQIAIKSK